MQRKFTRLMVAGASAAALIGAQAALANANEPSAVRPATHSQHAMHMSQASHMSQARKDGGGHADQIARARAATRQFHNIANAEQAGYGLLPDQAGITCIADDAMGTGAMGVHWANGDLVGKPSLHVRHPEALVYRPTADGTLQLAALEYVVIKADWEQHHSGVPQLYGQRFNFTDDGNRFGLPAFYSLHVWLWYPNPAGMFQMFNPNVHCPV
ncbi:MAG TPA: hypothetical protein VLK34_00010 [Nocardioidaceae bacterium]|nr:hypothetical protein [Nocardioidaceae bacterium]